YHNSRPTSDRQEPVAAARWQLGGALGNLLPLMLAVCGWCATLSLCRILLSRESAQLAQTAAITTRSIRNKITSSISTQVAPLEALVAGWRADADVRQPELESEAQLREKYP